MTAAAEDRHNGAALALIALLPLVPRVLPLLLSLLHWTQTPLTPLHWRTQPRKTLLLLWLKVLCWLQRSPTAPLAPHLRRRQTVRLRYQLGQLPCPHLLRWIYS
jgi:hypothetical protein